jgi:hypothetical protein
VKYINQKSLAGIQYHGLAGISASCLDAIIRLLQFGDKIHKAKLLSSFGEHSGTHCFLLTINHDELIAINTGFSSGYGGEGPAALSTALQLLKKHGVEIDEYEVSPELIDRVAMACLTSKDITSIESSQPVRPMRFFDYVFDRQGRLDNNEKTLLRRFPEAMPFGIIDSRLYDLALNFETQPDNSIMSGYRRLEDIVRERTGLTESNAKLFSKAFQGEEPILFWKGINDAGELSGRASLFTATYMAFRNRRAHREPDPYAGGSLQEFLLLNHLYWLEKESVVRENSKSATTQ